MISIIATVPAILSPLATPLQAKFSHYLAFGKDAHKILSENLNKNEYCKLIKLTHYSHHKGKEAYKEAVFKEIGLSCDVSG